MLKSWLSKLRRQEGGIDRAKSERESLERKIALNQGTWVPRQDMHPMCNIWGRYYRDSSGAVNRYLGNYGGRLDVRDWFFPDE